jgi:hypothetical protein
MLMQFSPIISAKKSCAQLFPTQICTVRGSGYSLNHALEHEEGVVCSKQHFFPKYGETIPQSLSAKNVGE